MKERIGKLVENNHLAILAVKGRTGRGKEGIKTDLKEGKVSQTLSAMCLRTSNKKKKKK